LNLQGLCRAPKARGTRAVPPYDFLTVRLCSRVNCGKIHRSRHNMVNEAASTGEALIGRAVVSGSQTRQDPTQFAKFIAAGIKWVNESLVPEGGAASGFGETP